MKLDVLVFAAHPDDAELGCSGTILKHVAMGHQVGVVDLTEGQLGSRGSVELRYEEAAAATKILGLAARENLKMEDGFFENDGAHRMKVIKAIRKYQPTVVLCNAPEDRHPDHGRGSILVKEACFYSGLKAIETKADGRYQMHWRPKAVYHYVQDHYHTPDLVVDITDFWDKRMEAILAYKSQFYDPNNTGPETPISSKAFLEILKGRALEFGRRINVTYGEGFLVTRPAGVEDLTSLI